VKLTQRIQFLLKTVLNDLFGEEQLSAAHPDLSADGSAARLNGLLDAAQQQLDALRLELAGAVTRQKRITHDWQSTLARVQSLNAAVNEALQTGQDEHARLLQEQANLVQKQVDELAEMVMACEQHTSGIRTALSSQQERLDSLRRRSQYLDDREKSVVLLAELLGAQQSLTSQTDTLQSEFAAWEEQIARREDRLAARREWSK